jgi:1-acyl-sn-glycerol-3-phosphate acyltransferase
MPTARAVILALLCALLTFILMPLQWLMRKLHLPAPKTIPQFYHRSVCKLLNIKITVEGDIGKKPILVVANHVSWLDIPVIGSIWPVHFVAKKEVGTWPVFASLAKLQNTIFVDRGRRQSTLSSRNEIRARVKNGDTVVLFPEGTSNNGREVLPFKSTFFSVVENTHLPATALTLVYETQTGLPMMRRQRPSVAWVGDTEMLPHLWNFLKSGPISVRIIVHTPLRAENRKTMAKAAHAQIKTSLVEALRGMR